MRITLREHERLFKQNITAFLLANEKITLEEALDLIDLDYKEFLNVCKKYLK
jgi:hypothetical protein